MRNNEPKPLARRSRHGQHAKTFPASPQSDGDFVKSRNENALLQTFAISALTGATVRRGRSTARDLQMHAMIRKLSSGQYRLYSRKVNPHTGKRRNLGTFDTRAAAERHEREVQYFKRH